MFAVQSKINLYGPFKSADDAARWIEAKAALFDTKLVIRPLKKP
jgi:hypothetical protein